MLNGYQTATQGLQISGSTAVTASFTLQALPSTVNGTVTDATTTCPLPGISVNSYVNNVLIASVLTNSSGQYVIPGLASGSYVFTAVANSYQTGVSGEPACECNGCKSEGLPLQVAYLECGSQAAALQILKGYECICNTNKRVCHLW